MTEDEKFQKLETAHTIAQLLNTHDQLHVGLEIILDVYFLPRPQADPAGALKRLKMFGYEAELVDKDGALAVKTPPTQFALEPIWEHEDRTTKLVAQHGFTPDGWGFLQP